MNQKQKIQFRNSIRSDSYNKSAVKNTEALNILMERYNLSSEEAERVLLRLTHEKRRKDLNSETSGNKFEKPLQSPTTSGIQQQKIQFRNSIKSDSYNKSAVKNTEALNILMERYNLSSEEAERVLLRLTHEKRRKDLNSETSGNKFKKPLQSSSMSEIQQQKIRDQKIQGQKVEDQKIQSVSPKYKNVDSILTDMIPNYEKQVSIELDKINLTFEIEYDKIDTLKESFIRTITRTKPKKMKVHALKNISFKIFNGEKIGIIGYNGAGKSTLLHVIAGIYTPDTGKVKTYGNISPLLTLGAGFDMNYSGRKNIFLNGAVLGYDKQYLESKLDEIIEFSELGDFIDIPIKNYSSGMLAKLGFSIATAVEPDILIIDEILGVGDVNFRKKSNDKMLSLMDTGTTVILVSHSIPQIRKLCDKAIWIDNGQIRKIGEVNEVCDEYLKDAQNASREQLSNIKLD